MNYGFCLKYNKYNSLSFRVWVNNKGGDSSIGGDKEVTEEEKKVSKMIRLKPKKLNKDVLTYLRANLLNKYEGEYKHELLLSAPVDF